MSYSKRTLETKEAIPESFFTKNGVKLIILIEHEGFIKSADNLAQASPMGVERWVVHLESPDYSKLMQQIKGLEKNVVAFSLNAKNQLAYSIIDQALDGVEADYAFTQAL